MTLEGRTTISARLVSETTETAVVDKPAEQEDDGHGRHGALLRLDGEQFVKAFDDRLGLLLLHPVPGARHQAHARHV